MEIKCGQCIGCRLERSRQWATRCYHESTLYDDNCFITLTFSDEGLEKREKEYIRKNKILLSKGKEVKDVPSKLSIHTPDIQLFMKRLRKHYGKDIRFFACGEYGDENRRPHYHACLFNFDFPDKKFLRRTDHGDKLWTSEKLEKLWPYGHSTIGSMTFETAAYVARYCVKKVNGPPQRKHYQVFNRETWEVVDLTPEFVTMSRGGKDGKGGIGFPWFEKYNKEVYDNDCVVVRGKEIPAPRYYDEKLKQMDEFHYDQIKDERLKNRVPHIDNTPERLEIREKVKQRRANELKRKV